MVALTDFVEVNNRMDAAEGDGQYGTQYDFGQKGYVALIDMTIVLNSMDQLIVIENYDN